MEENAKHLEYEEELKQEIIKLVHEFFTSLGEEISKEKKGG